MIGVGVYHVSSTGKEHFSGLISCNVARMVLLNSCVVNVSFPSMLGSKHFPTMRVAEAVPQ